MSETESTVSVAATPMNPNGWQLGHRIYPPMAGNVRLIKLTAKKTADGAYTVACTANGAHIEAWVENAPAKIGQAVIDLESGVYGTPIK